MKNKKRSSAVLFQTLIVIALVVLLNVISNQLYTYVDLTQDKKFTLESSTINLLEDVDDIIYIEVLLDGEMDASLKKLRERTLEVIKQFKSANSQIEYSFINPAEGTVEERNTVARNLASDGINPINLRVQDGNSVEERLIYTYAIIKSGSRKLAINLLEPVSRGESNIDGINKSMNLLEYKLANGIANLTTDKIPLIAFTAGNGELLPQQTATLEQELGGTIEFGRVDLDTIINIPTLLDVLIVARPRQAMSIQNQFKIDQYIMNGGKVIWFVDQFDISLDSINQNQFFVPRKIEHGLDELFFKYGLRINSDLILDLQNTPIVQVIGSQGGQEQRQLFDWVYHPLLQANQENNIVKSIDRVRSTFPSSITLLTERPGLKSEVLLSSSDYSRRQLYPMRLSFEILRIEPKTEAYNKKQIPVAVMMTGKFESFFKNRVNQEMNTSLQKAGSSFREQSDETTQVFVTDPDIIKNMFDPNSSRISPMGYNPWTDQTSNGNKQFIVNLIETLVDDYNLSDARTKTIKLRLLDQVELQNNKLKWQMINVVAPVVLIILFGIFFNLIRKRKYGKS